MMKKRKSKSSCHATGFSVVIAGLDPAIHHFLIKLDAPVKPVHDALTHVAPEIGTVLLKQSLQRFNRSLSKRGIAGKRQMGGGAPAA